MSIQITKSRYLSEPLVPRYLVAAALYLSIYLSTFS